MSRLRGIAAFLWEMCPPHLLLPLGVARFCAVYLGLQALAGSDALVLGPRAVTGTASLILFVVLARVYDELKDADTDRRLAATGDPRTASRPIVRGIVDEADLRALRNVLIVALIALQLPGAAPLPLAGFALALAVFWLSSNWFFWPAVERHLLLALLTTSPLTLFVLAYVATLFAADFGAGRLGASTALLLFGLYAPMLAWETSRKVRVPADETDYETYTKTLGPRRALALPITFALVTVALLASFAVRVGLPAPFFWALGSAGALFVGACLAFVIAPSRRRAHLEPFAQVFLLVADFGLAIGLACAFSVTWAA
ncbi:MAG: hypothetical protein QF903_16190 [Planctomycetota bacterium]|jgi:hypothetical protein|nr:hypothetical protein [Planctomycetota bacterium]MDP6991011.1 hypothetical protein [Planctomycetota bacterium]